MHPKIWMFLVLPYSEEHTYIFSGKLKFFRTVRVCPSFCIAARHASSGEKFSFFTFWEEHIAHWEEQRHNSKFDKMDLSILVKSPFHSAYFSKSIIAVSSKLTRERAQKSWWHNTYMRYIKSKIASPENPQIWTCDVVLPNERYEHWKCKQDTTRIILFCNFDYF